MDARTACDPTMPLPRTTRQTVFDDAIAQMSATGFDMVVFSFGSGFQLENSSDVYLAQVKRNVEKAQVRHACAAPAVPALALRLCRVRWPGFPCA